jgi:hypothetical protein
MKKIKILFTAYLMLISNLIFAQSQILISFDKNRYSIDNSEKTKIENFLKQNTKSDGLIFSIKGYADSDGDDEYNLELSKKRMETVKNELLKAGIPHYQFNLNYLGETNPIADNSSELGKQENRRVELKIVKPNASTIYQRFKKEPQKFFANPKEVIQIKGKEGTKIEIPKYSLVTKQNRTVTGEVEIFLEEYYSAQDILLANLHTLSNGRILETGGMINIIIKHKNEELNLKKGSEIKIEFTTEDMDRMETFYGENKNGSFNWKLIAEPEPTPIKGNSSPIIGDTIRDFTSLDSSFFPINFKNSTQKYLTANRLRWINCDRFLKMNSNELTSLKVKTNYGPADVKIIFKNINSIMTSIELKDNQVSFINLPLTYEIQIIGFTEIDGKPYYARKDITVQKDEFIELNLEKMNWEDFEAEINKIGMGISETSYYTPIEIE